MENLQYISFVSAATSTGSLSFLLETQELNSNVSLTLSVSGISGSESPEALAIKTYTQFRTALTQQGYKFEGELYYADLDKSAKFDIQRTENIVSVFSQTTFTLSASTNTIGCDLSINPHPLLLTLNDYTTVNRIGGLSGSTVTAQKIEDISFASSVLCSYLKNNIVNSTYIDTEITSGKVSIFTRKFPLRDFYAPTVRRAYGMSFVIQSSFQFSPDIKRNFAIDNNRREIKYRYSQDFFNAYEPFDDGNEVMLAYIAGYDKIPANLKLAAMKFLDLVSWDATTKSYKVEGFEKQFNTFGDVYKGMGMLISSYMCMP